MAEKLSLFMNGVALLLLGAVLRLQQGTKLEISAIREELATAKAELADARAEIIRLRDRFNHHSS